MKVSEIFYGIDPQVVGTHKFAFLAALRCKNEGLNCEQAENLINSQEGRMNRPFESTEVSDAVRCAFNLSISKKAHRWSAINRGNRAEILNSCHSLETLKAASPVPCLGANTYDDVEHVVDILFPGNPLLCIGESKKVCFTKEREQWRGELWYQQFIIPSPMSARFGRTKSGNFSARCKDNTGPRRFLVVEQDNIAGIAIPQDEQASVLLYLATLWPMALVCHSGGKSLHGWFHVPVGVSEEKLEGFFNLAVSLGADPAMWNPCQLARLPGANRENGRNQTILFFNPSAIK